MGILDTKPPIKITEWPFPIHPDDQLVLLAFKGEPLPTPRPRVGRHGTYYPHKYKKYRDSLSVLIKASLTSHEPPDAVSSFGVRVAFFRRTRQRTDVDNLLKTCLDAATGLLWKDDSQVHEVYGRLFSPSDEPRVLLLIYNLEEVDLRTPLKCARCGKEFTVNWPSQIKTRKLCSALCRWPRVKKTCEQCGDRFIVTASLSKLRIGRFCSRQCNLKFYRGIRRENYSPKKCRDCGKRVSRPEYLRCQPCELERRRGPKSHYKWFRKLETPRTEIQVGPEE